MILLLLLLSLKGALALPRARHRARPPGALRGPIPYSNLPYHIVYYTIPYTLLPYPYRILYHTICYHIISYTNSYLEVYIAAPDGGGRPKVDCDIYIQMYTNNELSLSI